MVYQNQKPADQVDELLTQCDQSASASRHPARSYEQGITAALLWAFGLTDLHPLKNAARFPRYVPPEAKSGAGVARKATF